ncbi:MAG: peptide ABC transporter substrate-binding protein [Chloroflexota bacterium]|nr:peptide ABC transporter substrate-binding protein [Chloroflexota bacterium]
MKRLLYLLAAGALLVPAAAHPVLAQQATQELTVNFLQGEPDNIDPNRSSFAVEAAVVRQVFQPLLRFDQNLTPQPAAASSYDVSTDGKTYTFHLRPDGRWSDGQPVTAAQFEYSWKRILDPQLAAEYASFYVDAGIVGADEYNSGKVATPDNVGVHARDDLTFEVDLTQPFGPLPDLAALWVVVPERPDVVSANPTGWTQDPSTYIGNGPFMMTEWVHQDHISLAPNPQYVANGQWPAPALQKVTMLMVTDGEADYAAYMNNERDWTLVPDSDVNQVKNDPALAQQSVQYTELTAFWIQVNNQKAPLDNVMVRRALAKAIDRDAFIRDITIGVGLPALSIIPPGMPGFQEGLGQELAFDPQGAKALLASAGFPNGQGFPNLAFSFASTTANQRRAEFMQAQWKQNLNITIQLNSMESKAYQAAFKAKQYDLAFGGWGADYPDPQDWFNTLFGCKGGNNKYNYCNPTFDQIVARADTGTDLGDRVALYNQAQTLLIQDVPVAPVFVRGRLVVVKPWVQTQTGGPLVFTGQDDYPADLFLDQIRLAPH